MRRICRSRCSPVTACRSPNWPQPSKNPKGRFFDISNCSAKKARMRSARHRNRAVARRETRTSKRRRSNFSPRERSSARRPPNPASSFNDPPQHREGPDRGPGHRRRRGRAGSSGDGRTGSREGDRTEPRLVQPKRARPSRPRCSDGPSRPECGGSGRRFPRRPERGFAPVRQGRPRRIGRRRPGCGAAASGGGVAGGSAGMRLDPEGLCPSETILSRPAFIFLARMTAAEAARL